MKTLFARLWRDTAGTSALEFAMMLPILTALAIGTIEFGRLILLTQKLQNGSFIVADLAARDETLSIAQLDNMFLALRNIVQPFEFETSGKAVVTGVVVNAAGDPMINWQRSGAGALASASALGEPGAVAALPERLTPTSGDTIIVAEVFYDYRPIFGLTDSPRILRKVAYFKPRLGSLETLAP